MIGRRVRFRVLILVAGAALCAGPFRANASVPDPRFSTFDAVVVGNSTGTPIGGLPAGFDVVVRDVNNASIANAVVTLDFSASGMKVYSSQNAGTTVNCAARTISRATDAIGHVNFGARVGGYTNSNLVVVSANGVPLGNVPGRSTDIDGLGGRTGLGDLAHLATNLISNVGAQETDFDLNGMTALGDLALFSTELLTDFGPLTYCP